MGDLGIDWEHGYLAPFAVGMAVSARVRRRNTRRFFLLSFPDSLDRTINNNARGVGKTSCRGNRRLTGKSLRAKGREDSRSYQGPLARLRFPNFFYHDRALW